MVGDAKRLSRISMKPTVKITAGIPRAQRASISASVSIKSTSETLVSSKQTDAASRCSYSKSTDSISCEKNTDASTSGITAKGKPGRRKSYTSLLIESTKLLKDHGNATKEQTLPKIYDDSNQLEVAEYVDEIYQHYWVTEVRDDVFLKSILNSTETVAKGWVRSLNPNDIVGGTEIGRGWCEVNVQVPTKRDEILVRPYGLFATIEDCVGATIAWPCPFISVVRED